MRGDIIKSVFKTVAFVTIFSCFERFLGFLYRIFLSRELGAEGIGIYQISLSVIGVLVTLTSSGIPITVSRLMMKYRAEKNKTAERQVISSAIFTSLIISLPITIVLYIFRSRFSTLFTNPVCYDVLLVVLPGVILTSIYAVIRGVFWGEKNFFTYSIIELIEEIVMIVFGFFLVKNAKDYFSGAVSAGLAILISYVVSFLISTTVFIIQGGRLKNPFKKMQPLLESSVPITLMRTATSLIGSLIAIIIPMRLTAAGYTSQQALASFGEVSGMALPLLFVPSTLIGSIALVLVPELSENFYERQTKLLTTKISKALKSSVIIASLVFPLFFAVGKELGIIVYSNQNAGIILSISAIIMLPMCITLISNSMLNSLNLEKRTLLYYLIGALLMILCVWFLPKFIGVYALIVGHLVCYLTTATLNILLLEKTFRFQLSYKKDCLILSISAILSALFGYFVKNIMLIKLNSILAVILTSILVLAFNFIVWLTLGVFEFKKMRKKHT